jgi:Mpv17 / PMP22 family
MTTKFKILSSLLLSLLFLLACCSTCSQAAFRRDCDFSRRPARIINNVVSLPHACNLPDHHHHHHHPNYRILQHRTAAAIGVRQFKNRLPHAGTSCSKLIHATTTTLKLHMMPLRGGGGGGGGSDKRSSPLSFLERHAFWVGVSITTVKAVLADLLTQFVLEQGKNNVVPYRVWNYQRTLVFGAFGLFYQGMVQYAIVNWFWERIFPGTKPRAVVSKICAMNLVSDPLLFMPTFYIFHQFMMTTGGGTGNAGAASVAATVQAALLSYKANCVMDWRNSWMIWFPGHAVTYGVLPPHQRIPWMAFLSFFYMCVLSYTRGGGV